MIKYGLYAICLSLCSNGVYAAEEDWRDTGIRLVSSLQAFLKDDISRPQFEKDISQIKQGLDATGIAQVQTQLESLKQNIVLDGAVSQPLDLASSQAPVEVNPGFSCYDAGIPSEYAICANPQLSVYDLEMSFLYYKNLSKIDNPSRLKQLQLAQRTWRGNRNRCGDNMSCLIESYQQRIGQLKK